MRATPSPSPEAWPLPTEQQRFLAAIVESAEDAIFAKSLEGRILSWNAGAERMYGYSPREIVGDFVFRLAPPDRHPEIESIMQRIRRGEGIEHHETIRVRRNGELFPVSLAISPVRNPEGTIVGASTIARDITEQRRLAESVSFQRSLLVAQAEASPDAILVVDHDGHVIFRNRRYLEIWGLEGDPTMATHESAVSAAREQALDPTAFSMPLGGAGADALATTRDEIHLRDGRVLLRFSAPVLGDGDRHYGRVWYFRDVTAEATMTAQLRAVISAIDDGAFVCAADGRLVLRNRAAAEFLPDVASEGELIAALRAASASARRRGDEDPFPQAIDGAEGEYRVVLDGETRWIRLSRHPIRLDEPSHTERAPDAGRILLLRDVTEIRDMQASREAFSGVLSHELRTPITTILGAAKMLDRVRAPADRTELLGDIVAEADRLYRLVEDLLVLTRIERASLSLADEPVLVGRVIDRVLTAERSGLRGQRFELAIQRDLPIVRGDDTYVEQIVRNLVGNALKYGPPEGTVRIVGERDGDCVIIRVQDEGPGIDPGEMDLVFELLYRSPATAAQAAGSGVGLFVSRRLAEAMGGRVWAARREGGGAEFAVALPIYTEGRSPEPEPAVDGEDGVEPSPEPHAGGAGSRTLDTDGDAVGAGKPAA